MYLRTLNYIIAIKGYRRADLSRMAHVSKAAVCKWFKSPDGICNMEIRTFLTLAKNLGIEPKCLIEMACDLSDLETRFLWDRSYPTMESFISALSHAQLPAVARLVQITGFHEAEKIVGSSAVTLFPRYKKYIKPARRKALEVIWPLYRSKK